MGVIRRRSTLEWLRSFAQDSHIPGIAKNASPLAARQFPNNVQFLKRCERAQHCWRRNPRTSGNRCSVRDWMFLKRVVNSQSCACSSAQSYVPLFKVRRLALLLFKVNALTLNNRRC